MYFIMKKNDVKICSKKNTASERQQSIEKYTEKMLKDELVDQLVQKKNIQHFLSGQEQKNQNKKECTTYTGST